MGIFHSCRLHHGPTVPNAITETSALSLPPTLTKDAKVTLGSRREPDRLEFIGGGDLRAGRGVGLGKRGTGSGFTVARRREVGNGGQDRRFRN